MKRVKLIKGEGYPIFSFEEDVYPFTKESKALPKHLRPITTLVSDDKFFGWQKIVKQYLDLQDHLEKIYKSQGGV